MERNCSSSGFQLQQFRVVQNRGDVGVGETSAQKRRRLPRRPPPVGAQWPAAWRASWATQVRHTPLSGPSAPTDARGAAVGRQLGADHDGASLQRADAAAQAPSCPGCPGRSAGLGLRRCASLAWYAARACFQTSASAARANLSLHPAALPPVHACPPPLQLAKHQYSTRVSRLKQHGLQVYDFSARTLSESSYGEDVAALQAYLGREGYLNPGAQPLG